MAESFVAQHRGEALKGKRDALVGLCICHERTPQTLHSPPAYLALGHPWVTHEAYVYVAACAHAVSLLLRHAAHKLQQQRLLDVLHAKDLGRNAAGQHVVRVFICNFIDALLHVGVQKRNVRLLLLADLWRTEEGSVMGEGNPHHHPPTPAC